MRKLKWVLKHSAVILSLLLLVKKIALLFALFVIVPPIGDEAIVIGFISKILGVNFVVAAFIIYLLAVFIVWKWAPDTWRMVKRAIKRWF